MSNILIASDYTMKINRDLKWTPKKWITRDGNTTVYWAISDSVPAGFVEDTKYVWRVDVNEATAFFSPEVLEGWHSEGRGSGQISQKPLILYSQKRELTVHEKLAQMAGPPKILPEQLRRPPAMKRDGLAQAAKAELQRRIDEYNKFLAQEKAESAARINTEQAKTRRDIAHICDSYGVPQFPVVLNR